MHSTTIPRAIPVLGALIAALAVVLLLVVPASADTTLTTVLTGAEEVPGPGDTDGDGVAIVDVDAATESLCYFVFATGIDAPAAAHIHEGADGVAGPVVVTLTTPTGSDPYTSDDCAEAGDYDLAASGDADIATLLADIEANPANYYVNVHNAAFPGGAIRGQLGIQVADSASSYINPDNGAATENENVDDDSSCETPDQDDTQTVSSAGGTENNVHNDACLFDALGFEVDAQVSFESSGVGVISACPDPDGDGLKTATLSGDGLTCTLSGYQETGMAGDFEYHARLNSEVAGTQTVVFCDDPEGNGCDDATISDTITITWVAAAPTPTATPTATPAASELPDAAIEAAGATGNSSVAILFGIMAIASISFLGYRTVAARRTR